MAGDGMSELFTLANQIAVQPNGRTYGLAKLYFYRAGTTTHQEVFTTQDLDVAHDQPVDADADGVFPPIFINPIASYDYRYQLKTSADVLIEDVDNYPRTGLVAGTGVRYEQTAAEISAGVTPTSSQYPEGNIFRYLSSAQITDVLAHTISVDCTAAIQAAFALLDYSVELFFPAGWYLINSASLTISNKNHWKIIGIRRKSVLVNKASSGKPTLKLTDCLFWDIEGICFSGRSGFPNAGFLSDATGVGINGFFRLKDIACETNGIGIEMRKINTGTIEGYEYWPSNGLGNGSTADSGASGYRKYGIFVDQTIVGQYFNHVTISDFSIEGVDTSISGGAYANIKIGADTLGACQGIYIIQGQGEGVGMKIELTNIFDFAIRDLFLEHTDITLTTCRYGSIVNCYNPDDILLDDCVNVIMSDMVLGDAGSSFTIDSGCSGCGAKNVAFQNTPSDSGTGSMFVNWSVAGVRQADLMGYLGIMERSRTVAMGAFQARTFSAGNYTSDATWTVESGDIHVERWSIVGKTVTFEFDIRTSTSASGATQLRIALPSGVTYSGTLQTFVYWYSDDNLSTSGAGYGSIDSDNKIYLRKNLQGTAFSNVTNQLYVRGVAVFEMA